MEQIDLKQIKEQAQQDRRMQKFLVLLAIALPLIFIIGFAIALNFQSV